MFCLSFKPLISRSLRVAMPLQRVNPFSLKGDTQQNIAKPFVLWPYHHPDEWKWFPHLVSFLFSFSRFCFPALLHSLPHPGFRINKKDLFIYCFLQPHPAFLATNSRLFSRQEWGVQTATLHCMLPSSKFRYWCWVITISRCVSCPQPCVGHKPNSPNNLQALLGSVFSLDCSSGKF